jgi:hypothetical protein
MTYQKVDMEAAAKQLTSQMQKAKSTNSFDARGFDSTVLSELDQLTKASVKIMQDYYQKVDQYHAVAKKDMDGLEALVKKGKKITDRDVDVVDTMVKSITRCSTTLTALNKELKAVADFRGPWQAGWKLLVSTPTRLDPYSKIQDDQVRLAKERATLRNRVDEYVSRAQDGQKLAHRNAGMAATSTSDEGSAISQFKSETAKLKSDFDVAAQKARNSLTQLAALNPKVKLSPTDAKMNEQRVINGKTEAKNARGTLKSFGIKVYAFKKTSGNFSSTNRKAADQEYGTAAKALKAAEGDEKKLADVEKKAIKVYEAVKKLK